MIPADSGVFCRFDGFWDFEMPGVAVAFMVSGDC